MQKVKEILEDEFGTIVYTQDNVCKTTVQGIDGNELVGLTGLYKLPEVKQVNLKRSGTGMTILVTLKS